MQIDDKKNKKTNNDNRKHKKPKRVCDYPDSLQGLPSNKFGGNKLQRIKGLRGSTYGAAGPVYVYSPEEVIKYANDNNLKVAPSVLEKAKKSVKSA